MLVEFVSCDTLCLDVVPIKKYRLKAVLFLGGLEGIRTLDPHNANVVRSQLRYKPVT